MTLEMLILPLDTLENIAQQKCLLPRHKFPINARPGDWVKCVLKNIKEDKDKFVVCQLFERKFSGMQNCCYMDKCVGCSEIGEMEESVLDRLELLDESFKVTSIDIIVVVTYKLLYKLSKKLKLSELKTMISILLQSIKLTKECTVRTAALQTSGIAAVHVSAVSECDSNTYFEIKADTILNLIDVKLLSVGMGSRFHWFSFESARLDLENLVRIAKMQKQVFCKFRQPLNALLVGPTGCGKSSMVTAFIKDFDCNCFRVESALIVGQYPGEIGTKLRNIFEAASNFVKHLKPKSPTFIFIEDLHILCPSVKVISPGMENVSSQLLSLVDKLYNLNSEIICIATTSSPDKVSESAQRPERFDHKIVVAPPDVYNRKRLFYALLRDISSDYFAAASASDELLNIVANHTQGYVLADLALLVHTIGQTLLWKCAKNCDFHTIVERCLKKLTPSSVRGMYNNMKTDCSMHKIGGLQQVKRVLKVCIFNGSMEEQAYQRFGLQLPKGVLLFGPPGCAKTSLAKCIATEAKMNFISTSCADIYSPYVGCAEKQITTIFDTARKNAPCLIFFDELDALVGRRTLGSSKSNDVQIRILSTLLTEMDGIVGTRTRDIGKHILVVAATNRPDIIDDALLRPGRFDKFIHVPAPDWDSRLQILKLISERMPFSTDVNLKAISERTVKFSGADLFNLCNEAGMQAFNQDFNTTKVSSKDFESVLCTLKPSLTQFQIDWYTKFEKKIQR